MCGSHYGYSGIDGDCDDADQDAYPGAVETCDPGDDDCDGEVDEGAVNASEWFADDDGDGYGGASIGEACDAPTDGSELSKSSTRVVPASFRS